MAGRLPIGSNSFHVCVAICSDEILAPLQRHFQYASHGPSFRPHGKLTRFAHNWLCGFLQVLTRGHTILAARLRSRGQGGLHLRQYFRTSSFSTLLFLVSFILCSSSAWAQKTVTKDAGAGAKEEVDYDASGHIVESRTIGPDGKLQVVTKFAYNSRFEVLQQANTSYWSDGKSVQKMARTTYDDNTNLVSENIEDYNQSGRHVSGHQLFHDPMTGIYRCFDWDAAQQKHGAIDCPASEESHEGPRDTPRVTREEIVQQLAAARQAAQAEQKSLRMQPKGPVQSPIATSTKEIGLVLPARFVPGQRMSGSLVEDPDRYSAEPELLVVRVKLPMDQAGDASRLGSWTFEWNGATPQPADGPISFVVPAGNLPMAFTLREAGDPAIAVPGSVQIPKSIAPSSSVPAGFHSPALCFAGGICTVTGKFSGDSRNIFVSFGSDPARVIAETDSAAYVDVPRFMNFGPAALIVAQGTKVQAMMMVVARLWVTPNFEATDAGLSTITALRVEGVSQLSDDQWHYGVFPGSSLEKAGALVPGFNPAKVVEQDRERREKQEKQDGMKKKDDKKEESAGMVLLVVNNTKPEIATMRGAKQQTFVFHLTPESGEFKFNMAMDGLKTGTYVLKATAIPFLAPVKAQVFEAEGNAQK